MSFRFKASTPSGTKLVTIPDDLKTAGADVVAPIFNSSGSVHQVGSVWIEHSALDKITYYGTANMPAGSYTTVSYVVR